MPTIVRVLLGLTAVGVVGCATSSTRAGDDATATAVTSTNPTGSPITTAGATSADTGQPATSSGGTTETTAAPDLLPGDPIGPFTLTYYWMSSEDDFSGPANRVVHDEQCTPIATVRTAFFDAMSLEGTGRTSDGRVLNFHSSCGCPTSPCFFEVDADHPWGFGVQNRALVPFRSVAVDTDVVAIGTALYLAELDGLRTPGQAPWGDFVHDGCVVADDIGGAIDGAHLDFFSALRPHYEAIDGALGLTQVTVHHAGERCATYGD